MKTGVPMRREHLLPAVRGSGKAWGAFAYWNATGANRKPHSKTGLSRRDPKAPDAKLRKFSWQSDD